MVAFSLRLHIYWMGKQSLFNPPFRGLMMWLGGIPVNREKSTGFVVASVAAIKAASDGLTVGRPPRRAHAAVRATGKPVSTILPSAPKCRSSWPTWTTIAKSAAWVRYSRRPAISNATWQSIKSFYAPFKGRNAKLFDPRIGQRDREQAA
jgi:hypothetical protein